MYITKRKSFLQTKTIFSARLAIPREHDYVQKF